MCLSTSLPTHLPTYIFTYLLLFVYHSTYLPTYLLVCLPIYTLVEASPPRASPGPPSGSAAPRGQMMCWRGSGLSSTSRSLTFRARKHTWLAALLYCNEAVGQAFQVCQVYLGVVIYIVFILYFVTIVFMFFMCEFILSVSFAIFLKLR